MGCLAEGHLIDLREECLHSPPTYLDLGDTKSKLCAWSSHLVMLIPGPSTTSSPSPHNSLHGTMITKEGYIPFLHWGQTFETYYKVVGALDNRLRPPLVVIHGGPGFSHDYLLPHTDLASPSSPVIFYDQIGNGRSSHLSKEHLPLLDIEFFIFELENLLEYFGIQDEYHIVGHSWGGMLAAEFVVRRHPKGLKRLVLTNSPASVALRVKSTNELLKRFPQPVQDALMTGKVEDGQAWRDAMTAFYAQHGCRIQPFPEEVVRTFEYAFGERSDRTVVRAGLTKNWSMVDRVQEIDVPTLVINGRYDFVQDYVIEAYIERIQEARWVQFAESSHMPFWEERSRYMEVVGGFLSGTRGMGHRHE